jgi:hypothetical protein
MEFLVVLAVLAVVVLVVSAPLRRREGRELDVDAVREELEAERDAKYREIRDAELDHRTGKLSDGDWGTLDRSLRAEAVELLRRLDELGDGAPRDAVAADPASADAPSADGAPPADGAPLGDRPGR